MTFDDFQGNIRLIKRLRSTIDSGNLHHAYIFEAGYDEDKLSFANAFVKAILCDNGGCETCSECSRINNGNHPDIHYVSKEKNSIKDESIEILQADIRTKPYGKRNIAVISDADMLTVRAQNRLLKILEEPPEGAIIIFLADNSENLLQTIRSRCILMRLEERTDSDNEASEIASGIIDMIYREEPFYLLKEEAEKLAKDKDMTRKVLDCLEKKYADFLKKGDMGYSSEDIFLYVDAIELARKRILNNMNAAYVLKELLLKIGG